MSKQITSVATMILVDEGKLDLDAPVAQYLPELKDMQVVRTDPATGDAILGELEAAKRAMTIRDLLRNTSGLVYASPDYADPGYGNAAIHALYGVRAPFRRDRPIAEFVASLGRLPLLHQPGEVWEYSVGSTFSDVSLKSCRARNSNSSCKSALRAASYGRQRLLCAVG